jgi:hypothetical protein
MIERRNPLPVGRYWIDISKEPVPMGTWQGFLGAATGFVHVESTEDDETQSFYIFTTTKELVWPDGIGSPSIAGPAIKSKADTVQRPDPEPDAIDQIPTPGQLFKGIGDTVTVVAVVVGVLFVWKILASGRRGKGSLP